MDHSHHISDQEFADAIPAMEAWKARDIKATGKALLDLKAKHPDRFERLIGAGDAANTPVFDFSASQAAALMRTAQAQ
jgi:hypothetical protein